MKYISKLFVCTLFCFSFLSNATLIVAGNDQIVSSYSGQWAWNGSQHTQLRSALTNPDNFGLGGIVEESIVLENLGSNITSNSLKNVDIFVSSWWEDSQSSAYIDTIYNYFLNGGDLILFQDDSSHDAIGTKLGINTYSGSFNPTSVLSTSLLGNGPFGIVGSVNQVGNIGHLDNNEITSKNGDICGINNQNQTTIACWSEGQYSPTAGSLTIIADVDMVTSSFGGANYSTLNSKGILGLNIFAFHAHAVDVPEPSSLAILALGLFGLAAQRKRKYQE